MNKSGGKNALKDVKNLDELIEFQAKEKEEREKAELAKLKKEEGGDTAEEEPVTYKDKVYKNWNLGLTEVKKKFKKLNENELTQVE